MAGPNLEGGQVAVLRLYVAFVPRNDCSLFLYRAGRIRQRADFRSVGGFFRTLVYRKMVLLTAAAIAVPSLLLFRACNDL